MPLWTVCNIKFVPDVGISTHPRSWPSLMTPPTGHRSVLFFVILVQLNTVSLTGRNIHMQQFFIHLIEEHLHPVKTLRKTNMSIKQ